MFLPLATYLKLKFTNVVLFLFSCCKSNTWNSKNTDGCSGYMTIIKCSRVLLVYDTGRDYLEIPLKV